jgi:hypothetical protein
LFEVYLLQLDYDALVNFLREVLENFHGKLLLDNLRSPPPGAFLVSLKLPRSFREVRFLPAVDDTS